MRDLAEGVRYVRYGEPLRHQRGALGLVSGRVAGGGVEDSEDFEGCGAEGVGHARGDDARYAVAAAAARSLNG
jgi:hypothetical protein